MTSARHSRAGDGVADLGLRLLAAVGGAPALSPLGVHAALSTLRAGAGRRVRAALDAALGRPAEPPALDGDPAVAVLRAQAAWVDRRYRPSPAFAAHAAEHGLDLRAIDVRDPAAVAEINAWASERTRGLVGDVVERLQEDDALVLADALFFDGSWTVPFDPADTAPAAFTCADGTVREVPTMHAARRFEYAEDGDLRGVRLPYGNDGALAFWAVIGDGPGPPLPDGERWRALTGAARSRNGRIALPRLRLEARTDLVAPLRALGLAPLFAPSGDLAGLFDGPVPPQCLRTALQRARVDVDERGTRAAAVTVLVAEAVSLASPFELRLDRPFLWAIEHRESGALVFVGVVVEPAGFSESRRTSTAGL